MLELWDVYKHNKKLLGTKTAKCNEIYQHTKLMMNM